MPRLYRHCNTAPTEITPLRSSDTFPAHWMPIQPCQPFCKQIGFASFTVYMRPFYHNLLLALTLVYGFSMVKGQSEFDPGGYNALRIENEIKLVVPRELQDSVWAYLNARYAHPSTFLLGIDSSLNSKFAEDRFIDQYFDNDVFQLVKMESGVRHRSRVVLTDSASRKNGRELMQIKINHIDGNALNRGEYKYPVKHYKPGGSVEEYDDHEFLGLVKRSEREAVIARLKEYNIDAMELAPTILINQYRKRVYIFKDTTAFATLTLDIDTARYMGDEALFTEMEMELNEIAYTLADTATRQQMEEINDLLKKDLLTRFPAIHQDQTPKYNKAAARFDIDPKNGKYGKRKFPTVPVLIAGAVVLVVGGMVVLYRKRKRDYEAGKRRVFDSSGA
jgi:hypothetical protein